MARIKTQARGGTTARAATLLALIGLGACGSNAIQVPTDSLTVLRVLGQPTEAPPLLPTPGNVWPSAEAERATMANTGMMSRPMDTGSLDPTVSPSRSPRRGSSTEPNLLQPGTDPAPLTSYSASPPPLDNTPPAIRRRDGLVIPTPNGPAITTGGGAGYSTYTAPGGGSGIATQGGGTTNLLGADGTLRQVPTSP